jgi:methyl-accepting chemotaxis protein
VIAQQSVELAEATSQRLVAGTLNGIRQASQQINQITLSARMQEEGVQEIGSAVMQLNDTTQRNAAASEELATTAEVVAERARDRAPSCATSNCTRSSRWQPQPHRPEQALTGRPCRRARMVMWGCRLP